MSGKAASSAGKILHNSFWYGLEAIIETVVFLTASIAVARYLGPQKMGYYSFINFFVAVVTKTSGVGLAGATRKYMSEFLALERPGTARAVYHLAYKFQLLGAVLIASLGVAVVLLFGDAAYKLISCILIVSIVPGIMSWVPAEANNAFEDASKNTLSAFGYLLSYGLVIALTVWLHWDLVGVASATLIGRTVEVAMRTAPLHRRLDAMPLDVLDSVIVRRIRRFCLQAIGIQLLMTVVWDRSEMVFLKAFSTYEQIAFYSISFSLANNLLSIPRTFGSATGMTMMVESSRDPRRVDSIMRNSVRYLLFLVLPVHLGAMAVADRAMRLAYGAKYVEAIPVMMVAALLAVPRAAEELPNVLLKAADRQRSIFIWLGITGVVNIALDAALIPHFGAVGAAWANGLAQTFGVALLWRAARQSFAFHFPMRTAVQLVFAAAGMALAAAGIVRLVPGLAGLVLAVGAAIPLYMVLVRVFGGLEASDRGRLTPIGRRLPGVAGRGFLKLIAFATPAAAEVDGL